VTPCCSCRQHRLVYCFVSLRFIYVKRPYSFEYLYQLCTSLGGHNTARFKSVHKHDKSKDNYLWFLNRKRSLCFGLEVFPKWILATSLCTSSEILQKLIRSSSRFLFSLFEIVLTAIKNVFRYPGVYFRVLLPRNKQISNKEIRAIWSSEILMGNTVKVQCRLTKWQKYKSNTKHSCTPVLNNRLRRNNSQF